MEKNIAFRKRFIGTCELLMAPAIWGFGFLVIRDSLDRIPLEISMSSRYILSFIPLLVTYRKHLTQNLRGVAGKGASLGILLFLAQYFQTKALYQPDATSGQVAFLTGTYVVIVPIIEWIFCKRRIGTTQITASLLCCVGVFSLNGLQTDSVKYFFVLAMIGSLMFSLHIILADRFTKGEDPIALSVFQFMFAGIAALSVQLIRGVHFSATHLNVPVISALLYLGFVSTMLGFIFQICGQQKIEPITASVLLSTETLFGMLFSVLFAGESISVDKIAGCVLIFLAILLSETAPYFKNKRRTTPAISQSCPDIPKD